MYFYVIIQGVLYFKAAELKMLVRGGPDDTWGGGGRSVFFNKVCLADFDKKNLLPHYKKKLQVNRK